MRDNWLEMLKELSAYRKKHGHCNVPANCKGNIQLGRWVAAQRYKRKIGALSEIKNRKLDKLGFVWYPADVTWNEMYKLLVVFSKKEGHCKVPERWAGNKRLANWVQSQRHKRRKGRLSAERIALLDKIGFSWAIYKCTDTKVVQPVKEPEQSEPEEPHGQRLYVVGGNAYVQYDGNGTMPKELERYANTHGGELPPYIPLPERATVFYLGESLTREKKFAWKGRGSLPEEVLIYVRKNGTLPRYD